MFSFREGVCLFAAAPAETEKDSSSHIQHKTAVMQKITRNGFGGLVAHV